MNETELINAALNSNDPEILKLAKQYLNHPVRYKYDPVGFTRDVLGVKLYDKQIEICEALIKYRRVMVKACNGAGKSFLEACLACWFYQTRNPSITIITSPTFRQVQNITFKEIRHLYKGEEIYQKLPRIESSSNHYVHGFTTKDANKFQGIHANSLFIIFDEAVGIEPYVWEAAKSILIGGDDIYWLAVHNPTDNSSQAYLEEQTGKWHTISISAFDHPNIKNELAGLPPIIPSAIRLNEVISLVDEWCDKVNDEPLPKDFKLFEQWYRPSALGEARLLGRWPSQSAYSIFSESDFDNAANKILTYNNTDLYHFGVDIACFGDDFTVIHIKRGNISIEHISYNNQDTKYTANRIKELARHYAKIKLEEQGEKPSEDKIISNAKQFPIKIDSIGSGQGVLDQREGYNFIPINNASRALQQDRYPNKRSESLFVFADLLRKDKISLKLLPKNIISELKKQSLQINYKLDHSGKRVAEPKDNIKKKIGRSPDDLDAITLAFLTGYEPVKLENNKATPIFEIGKGYLQRTGQNINFKDGLKL